MGRLAQELKKGAADMTGMAGWLDQLSHSERLNEVLDLGPAAQRSLWTLAAGGKLTLEAFVGDSIEPMKPVRHFGRNTLPIFKRFEKRFCRAPSDVETPGLWGYNEGPTRGLVGPGYFICRLTGGDQRGDVVIDYTQIPSMKPEEWPGIQPNEQGLSRLVYAGMEDFMRPVSDHITIGRAYKGGKATNNYFVLCREG
ncbi:MAG: hypothetical protein VX589_15005 [Myxococcota bacterium]|nr:hypothetical protein [Myxococcota bacterium]